MIRSFFSKRWLPLTIFALIAIAVTIRLGIWQLDRLEQRRAFNARVSAQINQPELLLEGESLQADLYNMEFREVIVKGVYDHDQEIAIRNQHWQNQWGVHLITPLRIAGSDQAILVDRGWIPADEYNSGDWSSFQELGEVEVHGVIRRSKEKADWGSRSDPTPVPGQAPLTTWNFINIDGISRQVDYPLLPAYVQQAPDETWTSLPYRSEPDVEITEGPHMGYAIQWFTFAAIIAIGYPVLIRRQTARSLNKEVRTHKSTRDAIHDQSIVP